MRIAIFDYKTIAGNPAGGCHLAMLRALAREHEFTVFSTRFENPDPARIRWVRVPVPTRPLALLFLCFHLLAPLLYLWTKLRTGTRFDLVQSVESNLSFGELVYAHFSHTTFLREHPSSRRGLRAQLRWLDNRLHASVERFRYPAAAQLVAPSSGLADELKRDFPVQPARVQVIPNPIAVERMRRPAGFDRARFRTELGFDPDDLVLIFAALGHFERKGLPILLEALHTCGLPEIKLVVVGGEADLIAATQAEPAAARLGGRVRFAGMQADIRPYLWAADAFILPSAYETFSLVAYEAAAAGLPLLATPLNGVCDLLRDGETGFLLRRDPDAVASTLRAFACMVPSARQRMGERARLAVQGFSEQRFVEAWRALYARWEPRPIVESVAVTRSEPTPAEPALATREPSERRRNSA